ncbi:addiction module HigA family antidote [Azospirillum agricola]|uniref:HigA family addiction module antitoxin n=1 Tax=Azospirillum agricola TaxID=1720247 RepID=UPI001AE6837E|nr:HigA family addiction module antitoxin [Azospirillum agricola]MBP2232541.1 addiction module HigA family antidote [Azospirillum agricola]
MTELRRNRRPSVPGAILKAHFMEPRGISVTALAEALGLSRKHVSQIINGHKRVEPTTAARLSKVLGTTPRFWLNLQAAVDEWDASEELADWTPVATFAAPAAPDHMGAD